MMKHKRLCRFFAFLSAILCLMSCVVPAFAFDAVSYNYLEDPDFEYVYRTPVPATVKYQTLSIDGDIRQTIFDISHNFLVGRKLLELDGDTYVYSHAQGGVQAPVLTTYDAGNFTTSTAVYATLINMQEDQSESLYGGYLYDNVQHSLILNNLYVRYSDRKNPQPVSITGGDFYIENLTKGGDLFYFYYYIKSDTVPTYNDFQIDCYVKSNKYGSEFSDEFRYTIPGTLFDRSFYPSMPSNYDFFLVFGVPLDKLGFKWDDESEQFVDRINGDPFEGLYISEYEISIQSPGGTEAETEFSLMEGSYRIDLFHALQPEDRIMRDNDLDAKLTVADDIGFHVDFIGDAVGGFLDLQIFPGFSLGGLLLVIIAFSLVMWFLRVFGGG